MAATRTTQHITAAQALPPILDIHNYRETVIALNEWVRTFRSGNEVQRALAKHAMRTYKNHVFNLLSDIARLLKELETEKQCWEFALSIVACAKCSLICTNPQVVSCGHIYCGSCLEAVHCQTSVRALLEGKTSQPVINFIQEICPVKNHDEYLEFKRTFQTHVGMVSEPELSLMCLVCEQEIGGDHQAFDALDVITSKLRDSALPLTI
ncbi:hypothetical protein BDN72DRAFT_904562 [Pluteus cervinus]|uniref:Uncharacterized protein n=1 Tax=Pluteus cervinus TaxID=181527 RepID=A0ACD3A5J2_9AGAR|nr:hypothetical protein BDN72DRAFT_904562 [Pluteus cervinus]